MASMGSGQRPESGLSVHVGVGCGGVSCFHVGSEKWGWQLVVSGGLFEEQVGLYARVGGVGFLLALWCSARLWDPSIGLSHEGKFLACAHDSGWSGRIHQHKTYSINGSTVLLPGAVS